MRAVPALALCLVACGGSPAVRASPPMDPAPAPANADELRDAEIPDACGAGAPLALSGGVGSYPSTIGLSDPGGVELRPVGTADLDGDGTPELIAYVLCMPGGSGTIDSVRAYHVEAGRVVEVAVIEGGDRADGGLEGAQLVNGALVVGRYDGDEEGLCCPTHVTDETWQLAHGAFVRTHVGARRPVSGEPTETPP